VRVRVAEGDLRSIFTPHVSPSGAAPPYGWGPSAYSEDKLHWYTLARTFLTGPVLVDESIRRVVFVMLNPSTAHDTHNDPTIARCCTFAAKLGYQELAVVNLYSWRETNPELMFRGTPLLRSGDMCALHGSPTMGTLEGTTEEIHVLRWIAPGDFNHRFVKRHRWAMSAAEATTMLYAEAERHRARAELWAVFEPETIAIPVQAPARPGDVTGGEANTMAIVETCARAHLVIAAWGADKRAVARGREVATLLRGMGHTLHCLGTSQDGHPRHPLYLKGDVKPEVWG
jgi:hypothetical protein